MLSVESLLKSRFPEFDNFNPLIRKSLLIFFRFILNEKRFIAFSEQNPHLFGFDFVDQALDYFNFKSLVSDGDRENIPCSGKVILVANHPIGSLDGLALIKLVGNVRGDVKMMANQMLSNIKPLQNLLLPVDNINRQTQCQSLRDIDQHLKRQGAVIIFPAGEVSRIKPNGIRDGKWNSGFLRLAIKHKAPIVPIFVEGRNSVLFYSLSAIYKPLSTLLLVREMFKQKDRELRVKIGNAINYETYNNIPLDLKARSGLFRKHIYKLPKHRTAKYLKKRVKGVAHPENRQRLREEIRSCELIGQVTIDMQIYVYQFSGDSVLMREIARLREISFRAVGEGSGKRRDMDIYDRYYDHILIWDESRLEIAGAYRLLRTNSMPVSSLYSNSLFEYSEEAKPYLDNGLELGRSFVQPDYWGKRSLDYLWQGIGAYLNKYPEIRYLFGPVSLSNSIPDDAKNLIVEFYRCHFPAVNNWAQARKPYRQSGNIRFDVLQYDTNLQKLNYSLKKMQVEIPTLFKQYTRICYAGGVEFADFNVDEDFENCIDGLVLLDLVYLEASKRERYLGANKNPIQTARNLPTAA